MSAGRGDRTASLVLRWCDLYTRGLPPLVARERRDELTSDLHDQRAAAASQQRPSIRRDVLVRAVLGAPADLSWRTHQARAARAAPQQEVTMSVRTRLDGWTWVAYLVGSVILAWSSLVGVGLLLDVRNAAVGSEDFTWRIVIGTAGVVMAGLSIHALLGLRTRPVRAAAELAVAALVSTLWMLWVSLVVAAGVVAALFFVLYAVRTRRAPAALELAA